MGKLSIAGIISLAGGVLVLGFQAIAGLVQERYDWESLTLIDLLRPELLGWYEKLPWAWLQQGVGVLLTAPLYILLFCVGAFCLLLSVFFRD